MAEFVPSVFRDLGKPVSDLFSRKYKFDKGFKARTKTADGLTVTGEHSQGDKTKTQLVARYEDKSFGAFEGQVDTAANFKGTLKLTELAKGVVAKAIAEQPQALQGSLEVDYKQANLAVTLNASHSKGKDVKKGTNKVGAAVVVGFDGLSLGGEVSYSVTDGKVADYNAGFQYLTASKDYDLSIKTTEKTDKIAVFGLHKYTSATTVASQLDLDLTGAAASGAVTFGASHKLDADTTLQGKLATSAKGTTLAGVWERTLGPQTRLALATEFQFDKLAVSNQKFGVSLVLGELNLAEL